MLIVALLAALVFGACATPEPAPERAAELRDAFDSAETVVVFYDLGYVTELRPHTRLAPGRARPVVGAVPEPMGELSLLVIETFRSLRPEKEYRILPTTGEYHPERGELALKLAFHHTVFRNNLYSRVYLRDAAGARLASAKALTPGPWRLHWHQAYARLEYNLGRSLNELVQALSRFSE